MTEDGEGQYSKSTERISSTWFTNRVGVEDASPDTLAVESIDRLMLAGLLGDEPELGELALFRREPLACGRPVRHEEPANCANAHRDDAFDEENHAAANSGSAKDLAVHARFSQDLPPLRQPPDAVDLEDPRRQQSSYRTSGSRADKEACLRGTCEAENQSEKSH